MNFNFSEIFEPGLLKQINHLQKVEIPKGTVILKEESYIKEIPLVIEGKY